MIESAIRVETGQVWRSRDTGNRWLVRGLLDDERVRVKALDGGRFGCGAEYVFPHCAFEFDALVLIESDGDSAAARCDVIKAQRLLRQAADA